MGWLLGLAGKLRVTWTEKFYSTDRVGLVLIVYVSSVVAASGAIDGFTWEDLFVPYVGMAVAMVWQSGRPKPRLHWTQRQWERLRSSRSS